MANLEHAEDDKKHVKMSGEVTAAGSQGQTAAVSSVLCKDVVVCSVPSFAAASELLSAPYSCLVTNTHRRHISLPPIYLNKKRTGIQQELRAGLLRFSQGLKGVPLAYDNIRILGRHGDIYDDSGYIHMNIEADFIFFQPEIGQKLLGKVNKLGVGHVGCLIHGCFNASILKPRLVSVETWRDFGPRVGTELEFEVMALDADAVGVLLIRGRLDKTRVQELLAISESSESTVTADQPEPQEREPDPKPTEESVDVPQKKKKKKKDKVKEEEAEMEITSTSSCQLDGNTTPELNGTIHETNVNETGGKKRKKKKSKVKEEEREVEFTSTSSHQLDCNTTPELNGTVDEFGGKKKKEKKKDKHLQKEEEEEVKVSHVEVHCSDSSGYLSDKSSKKRKREIDKNIISGFGEEPEPKLKKKVQEEQR